MAEALAVSLDKPLEWAVGFLFENTQLSLELWNIIAGISGFDDRRGEFEAAEFHHFDSCLDIGVVCGWLFSGVVRSRTRL